MASTYSKNAAAIAGLSGSDRWKYLAMMSGTLERLENQKAKSADVRDRAMLESQLKMRKGAQDFNIEMQKIDAANARAQLAAATKIEATALTSVKDYATKYATPYSGIEDAAKARARENTIPGRGRFGTVMGVLIQRATASGMTFDKYNPKFLRTFESVVAQADPAGEFFNRDSTTGEVTGLTSAGKTLVGSFSLDIADSASFSAHSISGDAIESLWSDYESLNTTFKKQTAGGQAAYDKAQELKKQALAATDGSARQLALVKSYGDHMEQSFGLTFQAYNIGDMDSVQRRVNSATDTSSTYRMVKGLMEKLTAETLGTGPKSSKMGEAIMRPKFQQWAKDHGFESIGTGEQDKDGEWSYIEGGDDEAAMKLYIAQRKKSKFNYGFMRSAGTGETVQVTLKDGSTLSGERAKVHSSDRPNILRIITSAGDIEFINTDEDIEGDVVILEDAPEEKSLRETIMGHRGVRQKERTARLVEEAARDSEGLLEDAAMVGEQYVLDKSGRYLSQDEYDKRRDDALQAQRSGRVFMKFVDGKGYLVSGTDVYSIDQTGALAKMEGQTKTDVLASKDSDPLVLKDGESARYATVADLTDGKIEIKSMVQPGETALLKAAEDIAAKAMSDEALGVTLTDEPESISESRGRRGGAAATDVPTAALPEDPPDEPGVVVPAKPWSPGDLDEKQKKAYDKDLEELKALVDKAPQWKDDPASKKDALATYTEQLNQKFRGLAHGVEAPQVRWEQRAPVARADLDEDEPPPPPPPPPPSGPLSELERAAAVDVRTHPRVLTALSKRRAADPAATSFTMGEPLKAGAPDRKKAQLTELERRRRAPWPSDIVKASKDLSKLMQVTKDEDVDVYETDEGLYMAMQKGQPLPAGRGGRLLTDIKAPPPVVAP